MVALKPRTRNEELLLRACWQRRALFCNVADHVKHHVLRIKFA